MKHWTERELKEAGYNISNAQITSVNLSMTDHGCCALSMALDGNGWGCVYGGYVLGHGYLGANDDVFDGSSAGMESIIRIMDIVGVDKFNGMNGKIIRAATKGWGDAIKIIGNVLEDKWFDIESFFADKKGEQYENRNRSSGT